MRRPLPDWTCIIPIPNLALPPEDADAPRVKGVEYAYGPDDPNRVAVAIVYQSFHHASYPGVQHEEAGVGEWVGRSVPRAVFATEDHASLAPRAIPDVGMFERVILETGWVYDLGLEYQRRGAFAAMRRALTMLDLLREKVEIITAVGFELVEGELVDRAGTQAVFEGNT